MLFGPTRFTLHPAGVYPYEWIGHWGKTNPMVRAAGCPGTWKSFRDGATPTPEDSPKPADSRTGWWPKE